MIAGYRQLAARARASGLRIAGATLPPFEGALRDTPLRHYHDLHKNHVRQQINDWMRRHPAAGRGCTPRRKGVCAMKIDLGGRTALVTGSTAGIGYAIARGLARAGANTIINGRSQQKVERAVVALAAEVVGADVRGHVADVGTAQGCLALVQSHPDVDILVNNVGIFGPEDFFATTDETWQRFFEVNVMSGVRLSRAYLPGMMKRGWGRVLFISSESAINIPADMIHYGFTKTAELAVSRGLAKRAAGSGVTVNAILPGPTLSDGLKDMLRGAQQASGRSMEETAAEFVVAERGSSLIRRAATVEEVANLAVYVASPQASATTGAALRVDGGVMESII